jgi:hypothetical protein
MELNDSLSPDEAKLAAELSQLAADPTAERRAAIMAAVRASPAGPRPVLGRWRVALAGAVAVAILTGSVVSALAASSGALPSSPAYSLRLAFERCSITLAGPADGEQLRISYATERIAQARATLSRGDHSDAGALLRDSRAYLTETRKDLGTLPQGEQGQVQNQLDQAQADQHQAEAQLNQDRQQGGS